MQELLLVISRCLSSKNKSLVERSVYVFHFKGFYDGHKISKIHLTIAKECDQEKNLSKGDDYLLWVKRKKIEQNILVVELLKYKKIH